MWRLRHARVRPMSGDSAAHLLCRTTQCTRTLTQSAACATTSVVTHFTNISNRLQSSRSFSSSAGDWASPETSAASSKRSRPENAGSATEGESTDYPLFPGGSRPPRKEIVMAPLEPLQSQMLPMEVVMAPGDSRPRMPFPTRADSNPVIASMLKSDATANRYKRETVGRFQSKVDSQPWPTLGPVRQLASGLTPTLRVNGIVRVGEDLKELEEEIKVRGAQVDKPKPVPTSSTADDSSILPPAWSNSFATDFERITHPHLVDLSSTAGFTTSSRDTLLLRLAKNFQCNIMGSTSSTTKILTQFIFSLGNFHPIQTKGILSPEFETLPKRASSAERAPSTMLFRRRREGSEVLKDVESEEHEREVRRQYLARPSHKVKEDQLMTTPTLFDSIPSVWAIDSVPSWSNPTNRILMELGHTLEAYFTHEPAEFKRIFLAKAKQRLAHLEETVKQGLTSGTQKSNPAAEEATLSEAAAKLAESRDEKSSDSAPLKSHSKNGNANEIHKSKDKSKETRNEKKQEREKVKDVRDAFLFIKMGNIMFRSQLDCWAPELNKREDLQSFVKQAETASESSVTPTMPNWPGWEYGGLVFDIKTRAVLPIRIFCRRYSDFLDYNVLSLRGLLYSFEREYYDMQRAAFMKYSLQCRIGRMGGVMVGYHNTAKLYGYHYLSIKEMDESLFGHTLIGEWMFEQSTKLMNKHLASTDPGSIIDLVEQAHLRNWKRQLGLLNPLEPSEAVNEKPKTNVVQDLSLVKAKASSTSSPNSSKPRPASLSSAERSTLLSSIPELSTMKCTIACNENDNSGYVNVYIELLPPSEETDPEVFKPFVQRYTSQRRVDSLPNYKIRRYLKELKLSADGNRVAITSRLESALSVRPLEELPSMNVFESLAKQNLIHKFVIQVKVSDSAGGASDPTGDRALSPSDINAVLQKWSDEYRRMDEEHASKHGFVRRQSEPSDDDGVALNGERGPSTHGVPLSPESLAMRLQNILSVSSSVTHFSVENGTISPSTIARQYRAALKISRLSDDHENEGDMVKLLQVTLKTLVESRVKYEHKREERKNLERKKREEAIKKLQAEEDSAERANAEAERMLNSKGPQTEDVDEEKDSEGEDEDEELETEKAKGSTLPTKKSSTDESASRAPNRSLLSTYSRLFKTARSLKQESAK